MGAPSPPDPAQLSYIPGRKTAVLPLSRRIIPTSPGGGKSSASKLPRPSNLFPLRLAAHSRKRNLRVRKPYWCLLRTSAVSMQEHTWKRSAESVYAWGGESPSPSPCYHPCQHHLELTQKKWQRFSVQKQSLPRLSEWAPERSA